MQLCQSSYRYSQCLCPSWLKCVRGAHYHTAYPQRSQPRYQTMPIRQNPGIDDITVSAWAEPSMLFRPCVDCGLYTGCYCDFCKAVDRVPGEEWARGQFTPQCSTCDRKYNGCHYCRGQKWCVPPTKGAPWPEEGFYRTEPPTEFQVVD